MKQHGQMHSKLCLYPGCFAMFTSVALLKAHIQQEHPKRECAECGLVCDNETELRAHSLTHSDPNAKQALWLCQTCETGTFVTKTELISHYHDIHDGKFPAGFLSPSEARRLDKILEYTKSPSLQTMQRDPLFDGTVVEGEEQTRGRPRLEQALSSSPLPAADKSVIKIILGNYTKSYVCPKKNCQRKFTRHHAFLKHLKWHEKNIEKMDNYLKSIDPGSEEMDADELDGSGGPDGGFDGELDHFSDLEDVDFLDDVAESPENEAPTSKDEKPMLEQIKTSELELDALIYVELLQLQL